MYLKERGVVQNVHKFFLELLVFFLCFTKRNMGEQAYSEVYKSGHERN